MFKLYIRQKLEAYVKKYFKKHPEVKLVVVAGSVGKTSTKVAISTVLSEKYRVRMHEGNHNTHLSAPVAILGIDYPKNIRNFGQWLSVFRAAKLRINSPTDVDIIVQELGTDRIGEIPYFGKYLKPDIGVVSAVAAEHMEFFKNMDNVAIEELSAANFSKWALINSDDIDDGYAKYLTNANIDTYGTSGNAEYRFINEDFTMEEGYKGSFVAPELPEPIFVNLKLLGEHILRPAIAAGAVAVRLGLNADQIKSGLSKIRPAPGRMNMLRGVEKTMIIDDTYNSSPLAASCALQTIYQLTVPQKIAVLGSMNELGDSSADEHKKIGEFCNPEQLSWAVTVGDDANNYLAPAAKMRGCQVKTCKNAIEAGIFVRKVLGTGAVILFKGSQGGVYLEESIKVLLHSVQDEKLLVRQSPDWLKTKNDYFSQF